MGIWVILFHTLTCAGVVVFLGGAALLFFRTLRDGDNVRPRRALAFILAMWGAVYLTSFLFPAAAPGADFRPMDIRTLAGGNLFIILCLIYPLELSRPGWISVRRVTLLLAPFLLLTGIYFVVLGILHQPVRTLGSVTEMLVRMDEFNVWYRLVLYLSACFYLAYLLLNTSVRALELRHRSGDSAPSLDRRCVAWLRIYGIGMACITLAYLGVMVYGNLESMVIHRIVAILFFGIIAVHAAFNTPLSVLTPEKR